MNIPRSTALMLLAAACSLMVPLLVYKKVKFKPALNNIEQSAYTFSPIQFEVAHKTWQDTPLHLPLKAAPLPVSPSPAITTGKSVKTPAEPLPTVSFILYDGDKSMAIIGGSMVKTGSEVRGWTVEQIEHNRVLIRNPKGTKWLKLE